MFMGKVDEFERPPERDRTRILGYRSEQVLKYVRFVIERDGIAPSYEMIADELGISGRHKVSDIVKRLEKRGLLRRVGTGRCPRGTRTREMRRIALGVKGNTAEQ